MSCQISLLDVFQLSPSHPPADLLHVVEVVERLQRGRDSSRGRRRRRRRRQLVVTVEAEGQVHPRGRSGRELGVADAVPNVRQKVGVFIFEKTNTYLDNTFSPPNPVSVT